MGVVATEDHTLETELDRNQEVFKRLVTLQRRDGDRFFGAPSPDRGSQTYGGQLLAQALAAAHASVDDDRSVHSLHAYFLRSGAPEQPLDLAVERLRDGRSFSQREVRALQNGHEVLRMIVSFHVAEPGEEYAGAVMPQVPAPDQVTLTYAQHTRRESGGAQWSGDVRPMDIRYVNPPSAPRGVPITEDQRLWMRINEPLGEDPAAHATGLAYLSDSTLVDHVVLPHGQRWQDPRLQSTSLDHAMWFHRPFRADAWLLFDQRVESTGRGRGLASGRFFTQNGELVATCLQEGLIRWSK
jgi:acyl-CoA thioesterase-2